MNGIADEKSNDKFQWFDWFNKKWNNYDAFIDFGDGINPKEVAENFFDLNRVELLKFFESLDHEDLDALDQMQKLTESEAYVFKLIRDQIDNSNKVKYVDFTRKVENE
tara:strand:- start:706 stop:1029 length:324 start_codon:yes stop_codon:yes gene_type:complete